MKIVLRLGHTALSYGWGVNYHIPPRPPTWYAPLFAPNAPALADKKGRKNAAKRPKKKTVIKTVAKAPPGMEDWVIKNKARFTKEYGPEKGREILYRTAWSRYNAKGKGGKTKSKDGIGKQPSEVNTKKMDDVLLENMRSMSPYPTSRYSRY
jgi:hypothetical protein